MKEELAYSEQGAENRLLFLSDDSKLLIFVEDKGKEYEYEYIFAKMFEQYKIGVFAMGGKSAVKKLFNKYREEYNHKPLLYLVDADFDLLLNKNIINHTNFIYLKKYNIESYFINNKSIFNFVKLTMRMKQSDVLNKFNYDVWLKDTYSNFKELFLYFAIVQDRPDIFGSKKNVALSPYLFLEDKGTINTNKIKNYKSELESIFGNIDILFSDMENKFKKNLNGDCSRLICGKYLIACLLNYFKNSLSIKIKDSELRNHLLDNFDIKEFNYIKDRIDHLYR